MSCQNINKKIIIKKFEKHFEFGNVNPALIGKGDALDFLFKKNRILNNMEVNKILQGDCLDVLKTFEDNSIDTIITDPPYGIGFMGKEWDNFNPTAVEKATKRSSRKESYLNPDRFENARAGASPALEAGRYNRTLQGQIGFQEWFRPIFVEMLRVIKPGGTLLCFGGARTYHRVACAAEEAGWILKDCIMWLYGSGFPKATDLALQFEKELCERKEGGWYYKDTKKIMKQAVNINSTFFEGLE